MLHPVLHLLAARPAWLAEHAAAYADLAAAEVADAAARYRRMLLFGALALCALGVAAVLAGVALMLWAVTPVLPPQAGWLLLGTPAAALLLALGLTALALPRPDGRQEVFFVLREQLQADLAMLREVAAP